MTRGTDNKRIYNLILLLVHNALAVIIFHYYLHTIKTSLMKDLL